MYSVARRKEATHPTANGRSQWHWHERAYREPGGDSYFDALGLDRLCQAPLLQDPRECDAMEPMFSMISRLVAKVHPALRDVGAVGRAGPGWLRLMVGQP